MDLACVPRVAHGSGAVILPVYRIVRVANVSESCGCVCSDNEKKKMNYSCPSSFLKKIMIKVALLHVRTL